MNRLRIASVMAASLAATAVLCGCSNSETASTAPAPSTSSAPSSSGAQTSSANSPATTSSAATSTVTTHPSTAGSTNAPTACTESQLREDVLSQDVPGAHVLRVTLMNTSTATCTLTGYPGAAIVDAAGNQIQQAKRVIGGPVAGTVERIATLTVRPGGSVFAYLEGQSTKKPGTAQAGCDAPRYPKILVTPPSTRTAVPFTIGWPQCFTFHVHPVREQ